MATREWLTYLRWLRGLRKARLQVWGNLYTAAIMEMVALGYLEDQPWDVISLSTELGYSRQTISRWVDEMVSDGNIKYIQRGRGNCLHPTQKTLDFLASRRGLACLKHWGDYIGQWEREREEAR